MEHYVLFNIADCDKRLLMDYANISQPTKKRIIRKVQVPFDGELQLHTRSRATVAEKDILLFIIIFPVGKWGEHFGIVK